MNRQVGVYKIENKVNKKVYVGESENIIRRWDEHKKALASGNHHSYKLQADFNEYGIDNFNFEILESLNIDDIGSKLVDFSKSKAALLCREHVYISLYDAIENGYNVEDTFGIIVSMKATDLTSKPEISTICRGMVKCLARKKSKLLDKGYKLELEDMIANPKHPKKEKSIQELYCGTRPLLDSLRDFCCKNNVNFTPYKLRQVLINNHFLSFRNHSYYATESAIKNEIIVLGRSQKNKYGAIFNTLYVTYEGEKIIYDILLKSPEIRSF